MTENVAVSIYPLPKYNFPKLNCSGFVFLYFLSYPATSSYEDWA